MVEDFDSLIGNGQLKEYIRSKISDRALPHALILEGAEGSGKLTVALLSAAMLDPQYSDKIKKLITPDVTVYEPQDGKKSIGVSLIRDIRGEAFIKPQELSVRVFIIRKAHLMTVEAQNALLKILEEPPSGVYFFLLCENASALLPTVRSRAPVLKMSVLSDEELTQYVIGVSKKAETMQKNSPEDFRMLIRSCGGAIGCAIEKLGSPSASADKIRQKVFELLPLLKSSRADLILLFFIQGKFQRDELDPLLLNLSGAMRDMLKLKYGELENALFFTSVSEAEEQAAEFARSTLMNVYEESERLRAILTVNVNTDAFSVRIADVLSDAAKK